MDLHLSPLETDVSARLSFLVSDELLFQWRAGESVHSKLVSAQDARIAFANIDDDSGWLPTGVVRTGRNSRGSWVAYIAPPQRVQITTDQGESLAGPHPHEPVRWLGAQVLPVRLKGQEIRSRLPRLQGAISKRLREWPHLLGEP